VRHLFRVATGLDSMVLGEPQILGQVKEAWSAAREAGALGGRWTGCSSRPSPPPSARAPTPASARTRSRWRRRGAAGAGEFRPARDSTVLLIGAGDTIELAARHLVEAKAQRLLVANRTLAHAQELASRHGGMALPLAELDRHLAEADIVISATASRDADPASRRRSKRAAARRHRPMLLLDLAVPRDIDRDVAGCDDVFLYTVDDLERAIEDNRRSRREAAQQAEAIIELQVRASSSTGRPAAASNRYCACVRTATRRVPRRWPRRGRNSPPGMPPEQALDLLAHTLTNRLLHAPTAPCAMPRLSGDGELARAAEKLFPARPPARTAPRR
jgi:glutamyl-tRNA reductase